MSRRRNSVRVTCGHPDCKEWAFYEADNAKHAADLYTRYGNGRYRCTRHTRPDEVLSPDNLRRETCLTASQKDSGRYWDGGWGFTHGPGFKAFAEDFPEGTKLRITAEIVLPGS